MLWQMIKTSVIRLRERRVISYIPWCIASYYIIKLPNARDPISSTERDSWTTVESDVFCRWNLLYLCCVDIFTIFVLLFQIYLLLSQRECFGRRYWLTCRPIAMQSTQIFASVRLVLTCVDKALHGLTSDFLVLVLCINICCMCTVSLCCLFVIAVFIVSSIIHRYSEYISRTVTVHAITSTSSGYVVENTEIIKEQKDVYRR